MVETKSLTKRLEQIIATDHIDATTKDGGVFGLIGTNGARKSTFLRMINGALKPDRSDITIDGESVFENARVKLGFFYISDDQFFFNNVTSGEIVSFYMTVYPRFDKMRYIYLMESFDLERRWKVNTSSKGMEKQVSVICSVCTGTDYLFCDGAFDRLDLVMRQTVKSIFMGGMQEQNLTPVTAPHNLRELEDICDHAELPHKGDILFSEDLDGMELSIHKIQYVLKSGVRPEDSVALSKVEIGRRESLCTLAVREVREEVEALTADYHPVFAEIIPLSLEEVFVSETKVAGYGIKKLVL